MNKIIEQMKGEIEGWEGADGLKSILGQLEKQTSGNALTRLFRKRGDFSITRTILIISWVLGLMLYLFGSLFVGAVVPFVEATVPAFDSAAFLAVTGAASSLYFANHNISLGKGK